MARLLPPSHGATCRPCSDGRVGSYAFDRWTLYRFLLLASVQSTSLCHLKKRCLQISAMASSSP